MKIKYDGMEKPKNIKKEKLHSRLIRYLFLVIFLVAAGFTAYNYFGTKVTSPNVQVEQKVDLPKVEENGKYVQTDTENTYLTNKFKELKAINPEVIAYMYVPGDGKDSLKEPILHTTNNEKYLANDIYGKAAPLLGAVFTDFENSTDFNKPDVKWVFGHARAGIEEKKITLDTRVFNNINWYGKKDYFDSHRVIVIETPERKYYYEVTGVKVVRQDTDLYQIPSREKDKEKFINMFKEGSKLWLDNSKISGKDNMAVFATCRLEDEAIRTLVLTRQVPDNELKDFLEKNKDLLNS